MPPDRLVRINDVLKAFETWREWDIESRDRLEPGVATQRFEEALVALPEAPQADEAEPERCAIWERGNRCTRARYHGGDCLWATPTPHAALIAKLDNYRKGVLAHTMSWRSADEVGQILAEAIAALQATPDVKALEHELKSLRTVVGHDEPIVGMSENEVRHIAGFQRDLRGLFQRQARESRQQVEKTEAQLAAQRTALEQLVADIRAETGNGRSLDYSAVADIRIEVWADRLAAILQAAPTSEDGQ